MKSIIYYYIFAVLMVAATWICHVQLSTPDRVLSIILTIIFLTYGLLLSVIPKNRLQVLFGLIAISAGFYGFRYLADGDYSLVNAIYSTFRLFLLDVDPVFPVTAGQFIQYPFAIELARFTAAACTISTVFSLVYTYFNQSMKLLWYGTFGGHIVISGYNRHSKALIENLRKQNKQVMLLTEDISESQKRYLQSLGVIVFIGNQGNPLLYKKSKLLQASVFIIFHEDDSKNLNEILALDEFVGKDWSRLRAKQVILHLVHNQFYELFEGMEEDLAIHKKVTIKPFNLYRLAAEKILDDYPLYDGYEDRLRKKTGQPLHLLFVGFGQTGRHMAVQAVERSHFMNTELLKITVLDKEAPKVQKLWFDSYPKSQKFVDIQFQQLDIEVNSIYEYLQQSSSEFTHIFICLKDDFQDLKEGIELTRKIPHIPIYLKMSEEGQISEWLQENQSKFCKLHLFGEVQSVLDYDNVINDSQEEFAKEVHKGYQKVKEEESGKTPETWEDLSTFKKESNRNQFNHAFVKLMLLGLQAVKKDQVGNRQILTSPEFEEIASSKKEAIATVEHQRWNTFHYIRGWDTLEHVTKDDVVDLEKKLHGCIVPYEELDRVSAIREEDYKQYDRDVVLKLYETMEIAGFVIVRAEEVGSASS
ncbi:NAD-binding protein [Neobacillus niacini]|uniref:NAD-binding protein n=1 Tax=Neobacillus niacini TaxID=86668 RepID=UPI0021CB5861|nr:NAD-binding protein [Neobacillus niacini]MCM3763748.1 NAD-binding protein [Neobacillus niacini]